MNDEISVLKAGVEAAHNCDATWVNTVPVAAKASGKLVWDGDVHIFSITGHPTCERCYAWWENDYGQINDRTVITQLRDDSIGSAADAVVAAMADGAN